MIDYYGVTFDHLVPIDDTDPEVLQINIVEIEDDGGVYANMYNPFDIDPAEYIGKKVLAVPSRRILPPVPVLNSGNVTFQMFSTMLASCPMPNDIQADLADFNALRAAAFRCGPTLSKKRFRLLVYSCVDKFATLTLNSPAIRVNLLSVILNLESIKRKAADDSNKKDAKKLAVYPVERKKNYDKHSSSRQHGTEDVAKNADRDDSPVTIQEENGRRSIYPGKEINPDDDDFQGRILLAEAVRERYLHAGVFHKQERYIEYLWDHRDCPERWPFKISSRQQNAINQISRAVETWIESSATTKWIYSGTLSKEDKTRFEEAKKLIRLLFEEDCTRRHGINQATIAYEPIELNAKRGAQKNYCPRDIRPGVFGSIKDYLLNPLLARNGLPIVNFMGHHVDGDDDENHDAKTRLRVIDAARLPFLWSALMKKVDGGWIGEIDGLWADFTRSEDMTIV
ncbi:hypothetical protein BLS_003910 [Venturia inaequalis]|uniref:Uncharacterized protein n=1 Tax=Venturia inaequalis TaxID=5025 RepID=A0A8H3UL07_VENIN|nr:hypothetical protein BLS_003910 [Venturia inaequalis]